MTQKKYYELIDMGWHHYQLPWQELYDRGTGKWLIYREDPVVLECMCRDLMNHAVIDTAKHTLHAPETGQMNVACLYANVKDTKTHSTLLSFLVEHNHITRDETITFKLDSQTRRGDPNWKPVLTSDDIRY